MFVPCTYHGALRFLPSLKGQNGTEWASRGIGEEKTTHAHTWHCYLSARNQRVFLPAFCGTRSWTQMLLYRKFYLPFHDICYLGTHELHRLVSSAWCLRYRNRRWSWAEWLERVPTAGPVSQQPDKTILETPNTPHYSQVSKSIPRACHTHTLFLKTEGKQYFLCVLELLH